jgi:hypothetical protein
MSLFLFALSLSGTLALAGTPAPARIDPGMDAPAALLPAALLPAANAALAAPSARALATAPVTDATLAALATNAGWRLRARAGAALVWRRDAPLAEAITTLAPVSTRTGAARFTDARVRSAAATPLLLERLLSGVGTSGDRAAIVEAVRFSEGHWSDAVAGLVAAERDPAVREQLVGALRHADSEDAAAALPLAAKDTSPAVRAAAMRAIGSREDGATYAPLALTALTDVDPDVRAHAARAVGWLGLSAGWDDVVALLADPDAEVRLKAVAALERLDPAAAAALPAMRARLTDPDARVARAAERLLGR